MKLSILIPTTPDRENFIGLLSSQIMSQLGGSFGIKCEWIEEGNKAEYFTYMQFKEVEVIIYYDNFKHSIGYKRNALLDRSTGEYIAFVDSDDRIGNDYFVKVLEGIESGADCCSLKGVITEDGKRPFIFEHSIKYKEYKTNDDVVMDLDMIGWNMPNKVKYERYPNHLNCIKSSIAKQFRFPEINHGEDTDFATQIFKSGLIKSEHYIDDVIYFYDYLSKK